LLLVMTIKRQFRFSQKYYCTPGNWNHHVSLLINLTVVTINYITWKIVFLIILYPLLICSNSEVVRGLYLGNFWLKSRTHQNSKHFPRKKV
jgi:hypothetical protein